MQPNKTLRIAIAALLSGSGATLSAAPTAGVDPAADTIQEITVTAQRRTENLQNVPVSIQALTGESLAQLNVQTFDDFVKYLPNVTTASNGPGQGEVYMRGLATGGAGNSGGGIGTFPNVAVYLDEQSGQLPGRNLDIYAADIERIEVLEGPQGTLFGAGAQAGVLRYITNKPKLDVTEGGVNAGYAYTSHGDPSTNVDAMINLPVIPGVLALRAVVYDDARGGYINNVPGTFVRQSTDHGIHYASYINDVPGPPTPSNSVNNGNLAGNAINPVTYQGIRLQALLQINDEWNVLLSQSYQSMHSQGVFYQTPRSSGTPGTPLPDLSVQLYNPSYDNDKFENTSLTVTGHIGELKAVYAGSYLVRNIDQVQDYTNYARGYFGNYYQCVPSTTTGTSGQCYSPSATWRDQEKNTHNSQEFRLSTPDDWRFRSIGGLFWEDYAIYEQLDWRYKTAPGFTAIGPPPGTQVNNPSVRSDNVAFFDDVTRGYSQKALFGSVDFDIIPKSLTITVGTRYYSINTTATGYSAGSFGCYHGGPPPCTGNIPNDSSNLTAGNLSKTYTGFKSRANVSWKVTPDALLYYTWSQGFRAGGFNRASSVVLDGAYRTPISYAPDILINNELGWKTQWFSDRLQFNGALYQENWNDVQVSVFDPCCLGNLNFTVNGPKYRVRGLETQIVARVVHGLTVTGSASWNSSELTNAPYLVGISNQPITSFTSPYGAPGSPLAQSPPFQANLRIRYEFAVGDYKAFWQVGGTHQAHSYSATGDIVAYDQAGYSTYDASLGIAKNSWDVQLYGQNLTDTRADLYANSLQFVFAETVNRPRVVGVRFSYKK